MSPYTRDVADVAVVLLADRVVRRLAEVRP